jgi:cytochrome c oxidase cbb3-type subunit I
MPRAAAGLLLASLLLFSILILAVLQGRRSAELSPAQWFVLAALFWFAWSYSAANHLLLVDPVRGTLQSVVNGWFTGVFSHLTLGGLALASLYYFLPRLTERPLHSSGLAAFAFWNLVAFGGFTGLTGLIGSPVPRWIPAVSGAATVCLLLPLACHLGNWHWTVQSGKPGALAGAFGNKAPLGFLLVAVCSFALLGLLDAALSFPAVSERLNLTYFTTAGHPAGRRRGPMGVPRPGPGPSPPDRRRRGHGLRQPRRRRSGPRRPAGGSLSALH